MRTDTDIASAISLLDKPCDSNLAISQPLQPQRPALTEPNLAVQRVTDIYGIAGCGGRDQIALFGGLDRLRIRQFGENRPVDGFGDRDEIDDFTHVVWHCADLSLYQLDQ